MTSPLQIWDLDFSMEYNQMKDRMRILTRNTAQIKWSPHCENMLASHTFSSSFIEIWNINQRFRPYRLFKTKASSKLFCKSNVQKI